MLLNSAMHINYRSTPTLDLLSLEQGGKNLGEVYSYIKYWKIGQKVTVQDAVIFNMKLSCSVIILVHLLYPCNLDIIYYIMNKGFCCYYEQTVMMVPFLLEHRCGPQVS